MIETTAIAVETASHVARVRLNRPESRNAVNLEMCHELRAAMEALELDEAVRVVVIEAAGDVFCAGADLKERKGRDEAWVRARRHASFAAYDAIEAISKPVVAVIDGPVVGSGGEIVCACDFALASDRVTFRFPEPHWGTIGATQRIQRVVGKRLAKELLFTSRKLLADEALARGLVNHVVPAAELPALVEETVANIAKAPPLAIQLTKKAVDLGATTHLGAGIEVEWMAIERNLASDDWRKGLDTFADRKPEDR